MKRILLLLMITGNIFCQLSVDELLKPKKHGLATDYDASTEYCAITSPTNLDFNGAERCSTQTDRDFETSIGHWTATGDPSVAQSSTDKHAGTYSMAVTTTAAGDATSNYFSLPAANFTTLVSGEKYTIEGWARGTGILKSDLITNGTNWTDSNSDGLADGWAGDAYSTKSIITGGGFDGNAQRIESISTNESYLKSNIVLSAKTYKLTFKYRTNVGFTINTWGNWVALAVLTINTGNALEYTLYFSASTGTTGIYFTKSGASGNYLEVDNITIQEITLPSLTLVCGSQSKTISSISCVPGTFTKVVWNFQAAASEVGQPIKAYINQADVTYFDDFSITQFIPTSIQCFFKTSSTGSIKTLVAKSTGITAGSSMGYLLTMDASNKINFTKYCASGSPSTLTTTNTYADGNWHLATVSYDIPTCSLFVDNETVTASVMCGNSVNTQNYTIGRYSHAASAYWGGQIGEILQLRNYAVTRAEHLSEWKNGLRRNSLAALFLRWNDPNNVGKDVTGYNTPTLYNIDISDVVRASFPAR